MGVEVIEKPTPPDGYRLLEPGERTREGDLFFGPYTKKWKTAVSMGIESHPPSDTYCRRIEAPQFQVGDRVRVKHLDSSDSDDEYGGMTGTVDCKAEHCDGHHVRLDSGEHEIFFDHALEKLPAEPFKLEPGKWYRVRVAWAGEPRRLYAWYVGLDNKERHVFQFEEDDIPYMHVAEKDIIGPWIDVGGPVAGI